MHDGVAGGVTRRGIKDKVVVDPVGSGPRVGKSGIEYRSDARAVQLLPLRPGDVHGRNEIGRVRERRHPMSVQLHGVPAHVVWMQVGVDDNVDVFGAHAGVGQPGQEVGVPVFKHRRDPCLALPTPVSTRTVLPWIRTTQTGRWQSTHWCRGPSSRVPTSRGCLPIPARECRERQCGVKPLDPSIPRCGRPRPRRS